MEFAKNNQDKLIQAYVTQNKSAYEIADELQVTPSKILRALTYLGIPRKSRSDAQSNALKRGRTTHPTKGKRLSEDCRAKISNGRAKIWSEMPQAQKDKVSRLSKERWAKMSDEKKREMQKLACDAVRVASREGSKMEKFLKQHLTKAGILVQYHVKNLIPSEKLEIDLFVPGIRTAIEIDGPAHFLPIWGEEKLKKHQQSDAIKSGLLINFGFRLIRVKQLDKTLSKKRMLDVTNIILDQIIEIQNNRQTSNLIEIEVKDGRIC